MRFADILDDMSEKKLEPQCNPGKLLDPKVLGAWRSPSGPAFLYLGVGCARWVVKINILERLFQSDAQFLRELRIVCHVHSQRGQM